jgi:NAD(P)-dependent dehydrogenase (short-subunit alcohol dehydrogenase family)
MAARNVGLIVGGGSGIGLAAAQRLASRGVALALAGRRREALDKACSDLQRTAPDVEVIAVSGDAGSEADAERMVQETVRRFGHLDFCVNCAGIYEPVSLLDMNAEAWRRTMSSTLDAMAYVCAAAARAMVAKGGGRLILISSTSDPLSEPDAAAYSAAKAGVSSLARSLAVDLAAHDIVANAVAPGWVHTDMVDAFVRDVDPDAFKRINLLGRVGQPDEIANVIEYLLLSAPEYLTGSTIFVDGGQTAMAALP